MRRLLLLLALAGPFETEAATLRVELQPVRICTAEGCGEPAFPSRYVKRIWAQAEVAVKVRRPVSSHILDIATDPSGGLDPRDALFDFAAWQGERGLRPGTAYMGFTAPLAGRTLGLAFTNGPGLTLFPYGIAEAIAGRYGAAVVAHELGHILGARHLAGASLMAPALPRSRYEDPAYLPPIDPVTLETVRTSPLLAAAEATPLPVPLPPAGLALAGAVLVAAAARIRARA